MTTRERGRKLVMEASARQAFRKKGVLGLLRYCIQKAAGMQVYEDKINTLNYFLNHYCSISDFPKAEGAARKMQDGDTLLLAIVDAVCKKHKLEYWLDSGTCLGAIRHGGFIPWDDDVDIAMMRNDYENARVVLKEELSPYGIDVEEQDGRIGIGYHHRKTGLWIDLFPFEYTTIDPQDSGAVENYQIGYYKYYAKWLKKKSVQGRQQVYASRNKYFPQLCEKENAKSVIFCPEYSLAPLIFAVNDILPAKSVCFENRQLMAPNNPHRYLSAIYGSYMDFPQNGVASHGGDRGPLSEWAEKSGTDMDAVIRELEEILNKVQEIE